MNILVAVDLSSATGTVVEAARGVAELTGVSIYVLHAIETDVDFIPPEGNLDTVQMHLAKEFPLEFGHVNSLVDKLQDEGLDASGVLVYGSGVEPTLKHADMLDAGLIVVGTHGHGAVYDVLIGSYSVGIIRKSRLPVLVVPIREE